MKTDPGRKKSAANSGASANADIAALIAARRLTEAESILRQAIKSGAKAQAPHALLAQVLILQSKYRPALAELRKALKLDPDCAAHHFNIGEIQRSSGDIEAALKAYRTAERLQPDLVNLQFALGTALLAADDAAGARSALSRAVMHKPDDAHAYNNLGNAQLACGDRLAAINSYRTALELLPTETGFYANLGETLAVADKLEAAIDCFWQGLSHDPDCASLHYQLGKALHAQGRRGEATACLRKAIVLEPALVYAHATLGDFLLQAEDVIAARESFEQALRLDAGHVPSMVGLGICLMRQGDFEAAALQHRKAVARDPASGPAWYHLSLNHDWNFDDNDLRRLRHQARQVAADTAHAAPLHFALANCFDRRQDYEQAFAHYRQANDCRTAANRFDATGHSRYIRGLIDHFDAKGLSHNNSEKASKRPIFIIGMPRSGTTLLEQILSAHPRLKACGERGFLPDTVSQLTQLQDPAGNYPQCLDALSVDTLREIARRYIATAGASAEHSHICDKLPGNYARLGLIAKLFPNAHIIHVRRHPVATCWSCYSHDFQQGQSFSYQLGDLRQVYTDYLRIMAHWRETLALPVLEIDYETLVSDLAPSVRLLLEFCGLSWHPDCLRPELQERIVHTASAWQVRQPIATTAVERWRYYAPWLGELQPLLDADSM